MLNNLTMNESLWAYRAPSVTSEQIEFTITRAGCDPDMLTLRNYATIEEWNSIIQTYDNRNDTMKQVEKIINANTSTLRKNGLVPLSPPNPDERPIV